MVLWGASPISIYVGRLLIKAYTWRRKELKHIYVGCLIYGPAGSFCPKITSNLHMDDNSIWDDNSSLPIHTVTFCVLFILGLFFLFGCGWMNPQKPFSYQVKSPCLHAALT
jgi:hypothetical protein